MTPILHPIVVRFKDKKQAAKMGFKKDYYVVLGMYSFELAWLINDRNDFAVMSRDQIEIVNFEDFSFNKSDVE